MGVTEATGIDIDQIPQTDEELSVASNEEIRARFILEVASQLDYWISEPAWKVGAESGGGISGWRERRANKKAGLDLASKIDVDDFADAAGYLALSEFISYAARYEGERQIRHLIELCNGEEDKLTQTPLEESMDPYRPGQGVLLEEMVKRSLPSSIPPSLLFEETATLCDLVYLTFPDGQQCLNEKAELFGQSMLGMPPHTPYETRLQIPDLDDLPLTEQLETHAALAVAPFNIQVMEHCYALLLGESPDPGIITDGPISRNGGLDGFSSAMFNTTFIKVAAHDMAFLAQLEGF